MNVRTASFKPKNGKNYAKACIRRSMKKQGGGDTLMGVGLNHWPAPQKVQAEQT